MLARPNRLRTPEQFRSVLRRGGSRRAGGSMVVVQVRDRSVTDPGVTRVGFVVSKAVGDAVTRNRVKRVLRHAMAELLPALGDGHDVVVRALPAAGTATGPAGAAALRREVAALVARVGAAGAVTP